MIEPRQQLQEQRERLYAQQAEASLQTVLRIIDIELHMLDQKLRRCTKEELDRAQGEAAVWLKLQKYITQSPTTSA